MTGTFEYLKGSERKYSLLPNVPSLAAAQAFASSIAAYTKAAIGRVSWTESADMGIVEQSGGFPVGIFGLTIFRNEEEEIVKLAIPSPDESYYDVDERGGYKLQQAAGEAQAAILGAITGETLTFLHGSITGHA